MRNLRSIIYEQEDSRAAVLSLFRMRLFDEQNRSIGKIELLTLESNVITKGLNLWVEMMTRLMLDGNITSVLLYR